VAWCTACGRQATGADKFCQGCGTPLDRKVEPNPGVKDTVPQPPVDETPRDLAAVWSADAKLEHRPRSARTISIVLAVCGVVAIGAVSAVIAVGVGGSNKHQEKLTPQAHSTVSHAATPTTAASSSAAHTATPTVSTDPAEFQARALDTLLTAAGAARGKVGTAVGQLQSCQTDPFDAAQTLQSAINVRTQVLGQLGSLNTSALPASLVDSLRNAEQLSVQADDAYQTWAESLEGYFCTGSADLTADFHTGDAYSQQATAAKSDFVNQWNPIAAKYGLATRRASDL
jgi:hypothetical protein